VVKFAADAPEKLANKSRCDSDCHLVVPARVRALAFLNARIALSARANTIMQHS
jgi:hypothetical protein